ncbi:MAG TPA: ABC transporter substrate-binding protein [Thermoplasmata archaeon]|nr:ABC transporter substrate-binding protein [Thermoplasmata archaeon]
MNPKRRNLIIIIVVVVLVAAGIGGYFVLRGSVVAACGPHETKTICIDQAELPDSLDPAVTFSTPGWAAVQQVYQGLVNYNGSSYTTFLPVLAQSVPSPTTDPNTGLESFTFQLRSGAHFSNGDPYNAYVQWYSFYRSLLLEQGPQFILEQNFYSTNFDASNPLNYYSPLADIQSANTTLVSDLNSWNFLDPTSSEIAMMETANQSFQVLNNLTIELNLGYGYLESNYTYLLASISAPNSYAVDPAWVDTNGGVVEGEPNGYLTTSGMGTGQYLLSDYRPVAGGGYTLKPDSSYWGKAAAALEPWNNIIQPANTTVDVIFQATLETTLTDLENGNVQGASFAYIGPATINELKGHSNVITQALPDVYGATSGSWWIYLNQSVAPFNNLSVREAIAHAINYTQIIQDGFGGYAEQWVGPVPPSYPYYNPAALPPYSFNLPLAKQEIQNSPCANGACSGMTLKYEYLDIGADWANTAQYLVTDLAAIGLTIVPDKISLSDLYVEQTYDSKLHACTTATAYDGGPLYMGQEFYTSDYISPDDWTMNDAISYGSANMCMSGYANASVDENITLAAAESDSATLTMEYTNITNAMYYNYTDIWLVVPTAFAVYSTNLHGVIENPMASAEPYAFLFNTQWLSSS